MVYSSWVWKMDTKEDKSSLRRYLCPWKIIGALSKNIVQMERSK